MIEAIVKLPNIRLQGIYMNLCDTKWEDQGANDYTRGQNQRFDALLSELGQRGIRPSFIQIANTASSIAMAKIRHMGSVIRLSARGGRSGGNSLYVDGQGGQHAVGASDESHASLVLPPGFGGPSDCAVPACYDLAPQNGRVYWLTEAGAPHFTLYFCLIWGRQPQTAEIL